MVVSALGVFSMNIRSLKKNYDQLCVFLQNEPLQYDLIILTEARIEKLEMELFNLKSYILFHTKNNFNQNSGIVIYIKNTLVPDIQVEEHLLTDTNCLVVKLKDQLNIMAVYRSPSGKCDTFIAELVPVMEKYKNKLLITGDINININDSSNRILTKDENDYLTIMAAKKCISLIQEPTRKTEISETTIDHVFVSDRLQNRVQAKVLKIYLTDHFSLQIKINHKSNKDSSNIEQNSNNQSKYVLDKSKLLELMSKERWSEITSEADVNQIANKLIKNIQDKIEESSEIKKQLSSRKYIKLKPWMTTATTGLLISIRRKEKLGKKLNKQPFNINLKNKFIKYNKLLKKLIEKTKNNYYKNKIMKNKEDTRKLWKIINEATTGEKNDNEKIKELKNEWGQLIDVTGDNSKEGANIMCKYFTSVGEKLATNINRNYHQLPADPPSYPEASQHDNSDKQSNILENISISAADIREAVSGMRGGSGPGHDGISVEIIKENLDFLIVPLLHLARASLSQAIFPTILKKAIITPIYKNKGEKNNPEYYRPISMLSNIAKIIEKIVKKYLIIYLEKNTKLPKKQYGFRKGLSTEDALTDLMTDLTDKLDRGLKPIVVLLDLTKAFDSVFHNLLIDKLKNIGIRGTLLKWCISYLTDRPQTVKLNDKISDEYTSKFSIPQGTVLGPVFFLIFLTELFSKNINGTLIGFADDLIILNYAIDWNTAVQMTERDLVMVKSWFDEHLLTISSNKTKCMAYSLNKKGQPEFKHITLHDRNTCLFTFPNQCLCPKIEKVTETVYLGIHLDCCLKWKFHIQYLQKRLRKALYIMLRTRGFLTVMQRRMLYFGIADSLIRYGLSGWGGAASTVKEPIVLMQKAIIRVMLYKGSDEHSLPLLHSLNILNVHNMWNISALINLYKHKHEIIRVTGTTRSAVAGTIQTPFMNTTLGQRHWKYTAINLVNQNPNEIDLNTSLSVFKSRVKKYYLTVQEDIVKQIKNKT